MHAHLWVKRSTSFNLTPLRLWSLYLGGSGYELTPSVAGATHRNRDNRKMGQAILILSYVSLKEVKDEGYPVDY